MPIGQSSKKTQLEIAEAVDMPQVLDASPVASAELFLDRLRLVWQERRFVFRVTAIGLALTTVFALVLPKRFESTTRLMPPDTQSNMGMSVLAALSGKVGGGLASYAGSMLGVTSSGDLFIGILGSRTVQDRLVNRFDLKKVYGVQLAQDARKALSGHTAISADRKSGIIAITVTDDDPQRAAAISRAYVEELNRLVTELTTSKAHRERVFLEDRLKSVQQDLEKAEKDFSEFSSKNMAIDIKEQGKAMVTAAATLQGQLIAAQSELEGFRQIYTDNNVRVRSIEARIGELKRQLERIGGKDGSTANVSSAGDTSYPSISQLPVLGVTYADMYRRTKVQEAVYEALTQEYELAKVEEVKEIPSVKVLDPADVPERKSFPPRKLMVAVGAALSFLLSLVWIFANATWAKMDPGHPGKFVVTEILRGVRTELVHVSENGSRLGWVVGHLRRINSRSLRHEDSFEDVEANDAEQNSSHSETKDCDA